MNAFKILGYNQAYHEYDPIITNPRDCEMWLEALRAKYDGAGKLYGRKEFDQLLGHCQVSMTMFADGKSHRESFLLSRQYLIYLRFPLSRSSFKLIPKKRLFLPLDTLTNGTSE
jgi:hypothetical protein